MSLSVLYALYLYYNSGGNLDHPQVSEKEISAQRSKVGYATRKHQPQDLILGVHDFKIFILFYLITFLPKRMPEVHFRL